jgi:agmatinase
MHRIRRIGFLHFFVFTQSRGQDKTPKPVPASNECLHHMAIGTFAYASHSQRFLACEPLVQQPFAVMGVPFDGAVTHRTGARMGPQAIRTASLMLCDGIHPHFNVSPLDHVGDAGDMRLPNTLGLAEVRSHIEAQALQLMQHHHPVFLGGDHSITLSLLRAARLRQRQLGNDQPLALLHFDAHCDTWVDHFGEPSGHGTWVYEAIQEGLVDPKRTVQVGLRSSGQREAREYVQDQGGVIATARDLRGLDGMGLQGWLGVVRQRLSGSPCYLSLDIDVLDPAFAPGTGTPEPGGLTSSQMLTFMEGLADLPWVGMDCVEVAPAYDHADLTTHAAATLVWTYLSGQVAKAQGL